MQADLRQNPYGSRSPLRGSRNWMLCAWEQQFVGTSIYIFADSIARITSSCIIISPLRSMAFSVSAPKVRLVYVTSTADNLCSSSNYTKLYRFPPAVAHAAWPFVLRRPRSPSRLLQLQWPLLWLLWSQSVQWMPLTLMLLASLLALNLRALRSSGSPR